MVFAACRVCQYAACRCWVLNRSQTAKSGLKEFITDAPQCSSAMAAIAAGSNEMDKFWEKMTLDEKCDQLRERIEMLVVEMANDQRKLHDRLVKLEQATPKRGPRPHH